MEKMMLNKIIRKAVIRAELEMQTKEYHRLQKQIDILGQAQIAIISEMRNKEQEAQELAEWIDEKQYEAIKKHNH